MRAAARYLRNLPDNQNPTNVICDHYFDARLQAHDPTEKRNGVLQDFLLQLIEQIRKQKLLNGLRKHFFRELGTNLAEQDPDHSHTCAQYINEIVATQFSGSLRIWFIIDALEECQHDLESAWEFLQSLVQPSGVSERPNDVRLFASYRLDFLSVNSLPRRQENSIIITQHNGRDIDEFMRMQFSRSDFGDDTQRLRTLLKNKTQGNFLWVYLTLNTLRRSHIPEDEEELEKLINEVPEDLSNLYDRILSKRDKMKDSDVADSNLVFQLLLFGERKLKLREIRHALALTWTKTKAEWKTKAPSTGDRLGDRIIRICLGLVDVSDDDSFVSFIHGSVRTHLMKDNTEAQKEQGHHALFGLCLRRLDYGEVSWAQPAKQNDEFYKYATRFWPEHARKCEGLLLKERPELLEILEQPSACKARGSSWVNSFVKQTGPFDKRFIQRMLLNQLPLLMAARGCIVLLKAHLSECGCDGDETKVFPRFADTALLFAVQAGEEKMVEYLLDNHHPDSIDAPVTIRDITALYQSCFAGRAGVVKILLDRRAKLDVAVGSRETYPLHVAARYGRLDVVETILDHDRHNPDKTIMALRLRDNTGMTAKQRALTAANLSAYELIEEWELNHSGLLTKY